MDRKELAIKSYKINSKYKRHTGNRINYQQKSCSWNSPHNRDWRKIQKKHINKVKRNNTKNEIDNDIFKCKDKIKKYRVSEI